MEREILERGREASQPGGYLHDFAKEWWDREEHQRMIRRERDLAFQIRMMDWGIVFFMGCLLGGVLVGIWGLIRWVMG